VQNKHNFGLFPGEPNSLGGLVKLQAAALEATANAVVITSLSGTVIWVNSAFERLAGYTHAEIVGQSTRVLKSSQNSQLLYEEMWRTILGGGDMARRTHKSAQGRQRVRRRNDIAPVQDLTGAITHYIAIKLDISG
jgi:PAS domain S-box-containing protein